MNDPALEPQRERMAAAGGASDDFGLWFTPARFGVLLAAFIIAAFPAVIFGNQSFVGRDFGVFSYPVAYFHRACFWRGELPLWNPFNDCGTPFLAQFNTIALYPLSLIYLLLPLDWSLSFFSLLHLWIAGMGMYVLCQRWTGSRFGAAVAGLAFAFNGLSLNLLMWPSHIATYSWMPWVLWSGEHGWQKGGRWLVGAVGFGVLQMLSGGPETILMTWLVLFALAGGQWLRNECPRMLSMGRFVTMVALVAAVSAAELLPFLDLVAHSERNQSYSTQDWSMPGLGWGNFLVPLLGCSLTRRGIYFQDNQYWTSSYYVGIGIVLLALVAVWRVRWWRVRLLAAITFLSLLLAVGQKGVALHTLKLIFPQLGVMAHPIKFVFLAVLALPLLAGFAVSELQQMIGSLDLRRGQRLVVGVGAATGVMIVALIVWARFHPQDGEVWKVTLQNGLGRLGILALTLGGFWVLTVTSGKRRVGSCFLILILMWADIETHMPPQNPTANRSVLRPHLLQLSPQPALGVSRAFVPLNVMNNFNQGTTGDLGQDLLLYRRGLYLDANLLDEIPTLSGFYSLSWHTQKMIQRLLLSGGKQGPVGLLDFLGVSQRTSPADFFEFVARTNYMPMITAGQRPVFLDVSNTWDGLISPEFRPREVVYLPEESRGLITVSTNTQARILSQRIGYTRVEVEVEAKEPSLLVVAQMYHPGWHARIGKSELPFVRANYSYQACQVPAGRNMVFLEYKDRWFERGLLISGVSVCFCGILLWRSRKEPSVMNQA